MLRFITSFVSLPDNNREQSQNENPEPSKFQLITITPRKKLIDISYV